MRIGKVNDWIRRYSTKYVIVKGTTGGVHFHLLAGLKPNINLTTRKGIHFDIKYLDKVERIAFDAAEHYNSVQHAAVIREERLEDLALDLTAQQIALLQQVTESIRQYWSRKRQNRKAKEARTKKIGSIERVLRYLQKNLDEPRDDDSREYNDYIIK